MTVEIIEPGNDIGINFCMSWDRFGPFETFRLRLGTIAAIVVFVGATDFFINLNRLHGLKTSGMMSREKERISAV